MERRAFLLRAAGLAAASGWLGLPAGLRAADSSAARRPGVKLKLALNAYSFNAPLAAGRMTLDDVIDFCAREGIDGVDATGYYFPGYPAAPDGGYVRRLKRRAFRAGVTIEGSGVRNDFANPDGGARRRDVALVKAWIDATLDLGANVLRVYSGPGVPPGFTRERTLAHLTPTLRECADYGAARGIVVAVQPHNDFLRTAAETIELLQAVGSEWCSAILDVGSLRQGDPYAEIERLLPYACSWQIKETVYRTGNPEPIDLRRVKEVIDRVGYRGFLPIEALEAGSSSEAVSGFLARVRKAML